MELDQLLRFSVRDGGQPNYLAIANILGGLSCGRPTLYLERELGEVLTRGDLGDFSATDLRWRWPSFKVCLPPLLSIKQGDALRWLTHFDVSKISPDTTIGCPDGIAKEIDELGSRVWGKNNSNRLERLQCKFETGSYILTAGLNRSDADRPHQEIYSRIVEPNDSPGSFAQSNDERALLGRLEHLAWAILVFLGAAPIEYLPEHIERKARNEGERLIPALVRARFVGECGYRAIHKRPATLSPSDTTTTESGRHVAGHWVAGAWRKTPYGPRHSLRRLTWIQPYRTHGPDEDQADQM